MLKEQLKERAYASTATVGASHKTRRASLSPLLFLAPAITLLGVTLVYPVLTVIYRSLTSPAGFVGFANYQAMLNDPSFWTSFRNNLIILTSIPVRMAGGLLIAAILYRGIFGSRIYRVIVFVPFIPSIAAMGVLFIYILNAAGPLNGLLNAFGLNVNRGWLTESELAMWSIAGVVVWTRLGFTVLLFLARLLSIDRTLFEAAFLDGASWPKAFFYIGLPELRRQIEFVALLFLIEAFSWTFTYVFVLAQGASRPENWILEIYLYNAEFRGYLPGLAAAVAVFLTALAAVMVVYRYRRSREEMI